MMNVALGMRRRTVAIYISALPRRRKRAIAIARQLGSYPMILCRIERSPLAFYYLISSRI
ncbi:MAG: hypothetical protein ACFE0J_18705 [Elainellaceae cyanobacterium]